MTEPKLSTLKKEILTKWHIAARIEGIVEEAYKPKIKIVGDESGKSSYTFGIIRNEKRFNRLDVAKKDELQCNLCNTIKSARDEPERNLFPGHHLMDFLVTINKFPIIEGFSLAITEKERPMFTTSNLNGVAQELDLFLKFADETGYEIFRNSPGFGATIPNHEHTHLTTFRNCYELVGKKYGLDAAQKTTTEVSKDIMTIPDFPFAHLIFQRQDPDRIVSFLRNVHSEISDKYPGRAIPHTISQGYDGILVTIGKSYLEKSRGSGDVAGHIIIKTEDEFNDMNYEKCISEMDKILIRKNELNLEKFI